MALPGGIALGLEPLEFVGVNAYTLWFVWLLVVGGVPATGRATNDGDRAVVPARSLVRT